jgi:hypothetical protein
MVFICLPIGVDREPFLFRYGLRLRGYRSLSEEFQIGYGLGWGHDYRDDDGLFCKDVTRLSHQLEDVHMLFGTWFDGPVGADALFCL